MSAARLLATRKVAKPWGRDLLPAPFRAPEGERIGEIWFEPEQPLEGLLAKYLFTSEKLSVQVHPDDAAAPPGARGKEECWLVLDAEPGATLAIGFDRELDPVGMRSAALDGTIESLLTHHKVERGHFFYLPAGTVHAIGAGISLIEIQQNSDITYRLYDYGRPRELHLEQALEVAHGAPYPAQCHRRIDLSQGARLVEGPHFRLDLVVGPPDTELLARYRGAALVMPISGKVCAGDCIIEPGACGMVDDLASAALGEGVVALVAQPV